MNLREKSILLARESDAKAEVIRREIEEKELKLVREAFYKKFGEYPDRVWQCYPFFYAEKEEITFKLHFAVGTISNGIEYFNIVNPDYPYGELSERLSSIIDLGRFLARKDPFYFDRYKKIFGIDSKRGRANSGKRS